jgi:hypothetical protein
MTIKKYKALLLLPLIFPLLSCAESPAEQCLKSFQSNLISPNSAKAIELIDGKLRYLAKNKLGVEIQGKAICTKINSKWVRDEEKEYMEILKYVTNRLNSNNKCRTDGNPRSYCDDIHPTTSVTSARIELGYN